MRISEIQYPVAFNHLNDLVKIEDAPNQRGLRYTCVHCRNRMSAVVLVKKRNPHFRHTKSSTCDPDSALHSTAIEIIRKAHNESQSDQTPYLLTRSCETKTFEEYDLRSCLNMATEIDVADAWESKTEKSIVAGTRSDLIFSHDDGRQIIIEVVNTHSMEPETENAYRKSGIPVAVVRVDWKTVNRLWKGVHSQESRNFISDECDDCKNHRLKAEADFERRRKIVDRALAKMRRQSSPDAQFRPFYQARPKDFSVKPTAIFMNIQRRVFANAIILTELGFVQSNPSEKPWLFTKTIHITPDVNMQDVILYADLGGSYKIPIYEDTAALLYTSLEFGGPLKDPVMNAYIVREFGERLQKEGVRVRISVLKEFPFLSENPFEGIDLRRIHVDPVPRVDNRMLSSMLRYNDQGFVTHGSRLPRSIH